jgi:hypothetical protein
MFDTETGPEHRSRFISGLRQLADYLDANPAVPAPAYGATVIVHAESTDQGGKDEVNAIAAQLGTPVCDDTAAGGHYVTERAFGPVTYRAVAIPEAVMRRHHAFSSYHGSVTPDD